MYIFFNDSIDYSLEEEISNYSGLFICAAGNYGYDTDSDSFFPVTYDLPHMISVGASNSEDALWDIGYLASNYGATTVDLFAPGAGIYSTYLDDEYISMSGTSMAAPYVTGVAALLMTIHPNRSPAEIKQAIINTVDSVAGMNGKCVSGGRLNAYNALRYEFPHIYVFSFYNTQKHTVQCTDCGLTYQESHSWNATHTRCLSCGYYISDPGVMYILLQQEP